MALNNVHDLFEFKLQGMYAAEKRNLDMLQEAASEAKEPKLREAFQVHRQETQRQVERIEKVFESLGRRSRSVDASVIEGLIEEKRRFLSEDPIPEVMDLYNLGAGIKTEHIEIAAYENLIALAEQMGAQDVAAPLRENMQEEQANLEKLMRFVKEGTLSAGQRGAEEQRTAQRNESR